MESLSDDMVGPFLLLTNDVRQRFGESNVTVIGADTIDGKYDTRYLAYRIKALNLSARGGNVAQLVNFSLSDSPTPASIWLLRRLHKRVTLWARDHASKERAEKLLQRPVELAPDIGAFLESKKSESVASILPSLNSSAPHAVVVPNAHFATEFGVKRTELIRFWVEICSKLSEQANVTVMPHDTRKSPNDVGLAQAVVAEVSSDKRCQIYVPRSAAEAKSVLASSSLCVSSRMHACIGALSSGVPTVGLDYLQKFEGQFEWYQPRGITIPFEAALNADRTLEAARVLLSREESGIELPRVQPDTSMIGWL